VKKILFFLFFLLLPISGFADNLNRDTYSIYETKRIKFDVTPKLKAELIQDKRQIAVQLQEQKIQPIIQIETDYEGDFFIQTHDFNFDGFTDFAVAVNQGYMGVDWFYNVYFFNPKTKKFEEKINNMGTTGEIEINSDQKQISGFYKSGTSLMGAAYRFQNGSPYLYLESDESQGSGLVAKTYRDSKGKVVKNMIADYDNNPVQAKALLKKVSLYDAPNEESKTKAYLVKNDQVTLLSAAKNWEWLLIEYDGATKVTKWAHAKEFWSLTPDTQIPLSHLNLEK